MTVTAWTGLIICGSLGLIVLGDMINYCVSVFKKPVKDDFYGETDSE